MDEVTFIFALSPPVLAIALSVFASVSDAYIERESGAAEQEYVRAGLGAELRESIGSIVFRVSKGGLLIFKLYRNRVQCCPGTIWRDLFFA